MQHGYHRFYEGVMRPLRSKPICMLEIGVERGASMCAWEEYFIHPSTRLFGIGYKNHQSMYKENITERTTLFMGDQSDVHFLERFLKDCGVRSFDIIIDDGSHVPSHQRTSFENLWSSVAPGGIYVVEDIETSYWRPDVSIYGYSLAGETSFVDYCKGLADDVNVEFSKKRGAVRDLHSVTFVQNAVILKKQDAADAPYANRDYRMSSALKASIQIPVIMKQDAADAPYMQLL
jgi:hypothetical protein